MGRRDASYLNAEEPCSERGVWWSVGFGTGNHRGTEGTEATEHCLRMEGSPREHLFCGCPFGLGNTLSRARSATQELPGQGRPRANPGSIPP